VAHGNEILLTPALDEIQNLTSARLKLILCSVSHKTTFKFLLEICYKSIVLFDAVKSVA
jgi:hypothetical protein